MADTASETAPEPDTLEALQSRHRKEQRDLVSRTTQKKKQASKKTRKGVNDECERLERELKERQEREVAALNGDAEVSDEHEDVAEDEAGKLEEAVARLGVNGAAVENKDTSVNGDMQDEGATARKKPNRAKARLARRAADQRTLVADAEREAANAPNPREVERERMAAQLQRHKLALHEIRADGHCLYAAVADQLVTRELGLAPRIPVSIVGKDGGGEYGQVEGYKKVRYAAADWIQANADDFAGFMEDPLPEHVRKIRETGEWGGHIELLALAKAYGVRICVLHSEGQVDKIQAEEENGEEKEMEDIWLGYYKHSHGLGEHYNSLRKAP